MLMISSCELKRDLGAAKHLIELAEELRKLDWRCDLISPYDIYPKGTKNYKEFTFALKKFLKAKAQEYDVVEYNQDFLPYPRKEFSRNTLFVARSVLLHYHFLNIPIPAGRTLKEFIYYHTREKLIKYIDYPYKAEKITQTFHEADLINVNNEDDKKELIRKGFTSNKVCVIPCGLSSESRVLFENISSTLPDNNKIVFVGTFDTRKGAADMPYIFKIILDAIPDATFKLLGTKKNEEEVKKYFYKKIRNKIEVVSHYSFQELPFLINDCSIGIFPSYIEGFGMGVLEMLAASIPVIAYNSPGPPMMLSEEYLVERGNKKDMALKIINLLNNKDILQNARRQAKIISQNFTWEKIAYQTSNIYKSSLYAHRNSFN